MTVPFFIAFIGAFSYGSYYLFKTHLQLWDASYIIFAGCFVFGHIVFNNFAREFRLKQQIKKQFSSYLSPDLVAKLIKDPSLLKLGGEEKELSIMFTDVRGFTTALAADAMKDASLTVTTASGATNTATQPTRINVTATTAATVYVTGGTSTWPVGTKVTIGSGTGVPTALVGDWTITGGSGSTLVIAGSGWTVADTGSITPGTVLTGKSGTIKTQSIAAGANSIAPAAAVTITPWA